MTETVQIASMKDDGMIPAYVARPDGEPVAGIIVIPEIFGVNAGIRQKCDKWAMDGYLALAPDIFWRFAPGIELDPDVPEQLQEAFGYFGQCDPALAVYDIEAAIRWLRGQGVAKVGCTGYCLGGRLAYMAAARTDIDASVGYYGVGLEGLMGEKHAIARPLMLHIAGADHFVTPDKQALIHQGLDDHPKVTIHDYPGEDHGFAAEMGKRRSETGADLADGRTEAFFAEHVG